MLKSLCNRIETRLYRCNNTMALVRTVFSVVAGVTGSIILCKLYGVL